MLRDCHLPTPQSPARDSASVTVRLRGTETWAEPLATVSFLEVSGFPLHIRPRLLVLGLTLALSCLLLIEHYVASVSGHNIVQCQSQIGPGTQRCWGDCCSSNSGRGAPLLGGGAPPSETEVQTTLEQGRQCQPHPSLASPHLEVNSFGSRGNCQHPKEVAVCGCTDLRHHLRFHRRPIPI